MTQEISALTASQIIRRALRLCNRSGLKTTSLHILMCMSEQSKSYGVQSLIDITGVNDKPLRGWLLRLEGKGSVVRRQVAHLDHTYEWRISQKGMMQVWEALAIKPDGNIATPTH